MNIHATDTKAVITGFAPASLSDRATTYALDAVRSIGRLAMRRVKRTADIVDSEYNLLHWQRTLSEKNWTKAASIRDFLIPKNPALGLRKVDNQICRVAADDYYRYRAVALGELLARHTGGATEIVELGAGCGINLLSLHLNHPDWRLRGFDIAPNGIAAGREIAAHYGLSDRISLDRIDLTDGNDPSYAAIRDQSFLPTSASSKFLRRAQGGGQHHCGEAQARHQHRADDGASESRKSARHGQLPLHPVGGLPDAAVLDARRLRAAGPRPHLGARTHAVRADDPQ